MIRLGFLLAFLAFTAAIIPAPRAHGDEANDLVPRSYPLPAHGDLQLQIPRAWKEVVHPPAQRGLPPTFEFNGDPAEKFSVLLTIIPGPADPRANSPAQLRDMANALGARMLPGAVENAIALEQFQGTYANGFYFTITPKAARAGTYEYATLCIAGVGDLTLNVMILHHQKNSPDRQAAIDMLKSAHQGKPAAPAAELRISAPAADWDLVLPIKGLVVARDRGNPESKIREVMAVNPQTGIGVRVFIEPARKAGGSVAARDVYWATEKANPLPKENIRLDTVGDFSTVQYMVPPVKGVPANQRNLSIYIDHVGFWINVHVSKMQSNDADQAVFDEIAKGIRIEKAAPK